MTQQYSNLLNKLNTFIKKFYKNRIIKGVVISTSLYLFLFLLISISEYFAYFNITTRTIIFYSFLIISGLIFIEFIGIPILKLFRIGKRLTYVRASKIISHHFTGMQDKLHNILELANPTQNQNNALVLASIDQKITQIKVFRFTDVIRYKKNIKYLKYLILPLLIFLYLIIFKPNIISNGTERIINHNTFYEKEMPFEFILLNDSLTVKKGEDFQVHIKIKGDYIPSQVSINYSGNSYLMPKKNKHKKNEFIYTFKNINNSLDFYFHSDEVISVRKTLTVLPNPVILNFNIKVDVPTYINETDKTYTNIGDITVPYGSVVTWSFNTKDIDSLKLFFSDSTNLFPQIKKSEFILNRRILKSSEYELIVSNEYFKNEKLVKYKINIIPDLFPEISVDQIIDSVKISQNYFRGIISDDYGFNRLYFNYTIFTDEKSESKNIRTEIPISVYNTNQEFYYFIDFAEIETKPGETVKYYFEVFDNDNISGFKSTRSQIYEYAIPTAKELDDVTKDKNKNIQEKLDKASELSKEIQDDILNFKERSLNEKMSEWDKTNFLEQIAQKQKSLQQLINELQSENEQKNNQLNTFNEQSEEILQKQEQIQNLLDELMTEEMRAMLEEIKKLQEEFDNKEFDELMKDMELNYDDLSEKLDRDLELLKQMEVAEEVNSTIEQLEELADEQEELSEQSEDRKSDKEEIKEKQEENKKEFDEIMEDYKETLEKNQELEDPMDLDEFDEQEQEIQEDMKESEEMLENSRMKKASKSQKQTSEDMKKMAEQMQSMMDSNSQESNSEDMEEMKQILSNLIEFSFNQEELYDETKLSATNSPVFRELKNQQRTLATDFNVIKDSLLALAKRNPMINKPVTDEISNITRNLSQVQDNMESRKKSLTTKNQRNIITSTNNLALLMNEILEQMKNQSQCSGGSCKKPGDNKKPGKGEKPSFSDMKSQQQKMEEQLKQMLEQMKGNQNGGKPTSKQLGQTLAEQEAFEQMLQNMQNNSQLQPETMRELNEIQRSNEEIKKDIINNQITPETLLREQQILTRLLEAENSENERKYEEKRESKEGSDKQTKNPDDILKKFQNYNSYTETLNKKSLRLNNFYKQKHNSYINKLNQEK